MSILFKLIYRCEDQSKSQAFKTETDKFNSKFYIVRQKILEQLKTIFKNDNGRGFTLLDAKSYHKATVIQTVCLIDI